MTWNWHEQVLMKYGITENHHNPKVSRISKNRCRIDNASVANRTTLGFDPDTMVRFVFGIEEPWILSSFTAGIYDDSHAGVLKGEVQVCLDVPSGMYPCPTCGFLCRIHQREDRYYSHPPMCEMGLVIRARIPKLRCDVCDGWRQMEVSWARPKVSYTKKMERYIFGLLEDMAVCSTGERTGVSMFVIWDMVRYRVGKALERMDLAGVCMLYLDETSSKKGHNYITVVSDQNKRIIFVCEGKGSDTVDRLKDWIISHNGDPERISVVSCDLGEAYPAGVRRNFPSAVVVYDRFHAVKLANEAMDDVTRRYANIHEGLRGMRRKLMKNPSSLSDVEHKRIMRVVNDFREVGECYRLKNLLASIYDYGDKNTASEVLDLWFEECRRSGLPEMKRLGETIESRREGILAWYDNPVNNGYAEGLNSLIQTTKRVARGYRNIENFIAMIYLRNGNLDITFDRRRCYCRSASVSEHNQDVTTGRRCAPGHVCPFPSHPIQER